MLAAAPLRVAALTRLMVSPRADTPVAPGRLPPRGFPVTHGQSALRQIPFAEAQPTHPHATVPHGPVHSPGAPPTASPTPLPRSKAEPPNPCVLHVRHHADAGGRGPAQ